MKIRCFLFGHIFTPCLRTKGMKILQMPNGDYHVGAYFSEVECAMCGMRKPVEIDQKSYENCIVSYNEAE